MLTRQRQGIRSALHRILRERGHDPESVDPWYFPSMEDYVKVSDHLYSKKYRLPYSPCSLGIGRRLL